MHTWAQSVSSCIACSCRRLAIRTNFVLRAGVAVVVGGIELAICAIFAFCEIDAARCDEFLPPRTLGESFATVS